MNVRLEIRLGPESSLRVGEWVRMEADLDLAAWT